jgi:hypothetical protein
VLRPLNVGVKVHNGTVTLWGPVPSSLDEKRAVEKVERVRGVVGVRSELYVGRAPARRDELEMALLPEAPVRREAASPDRESGALTVLTGRPPPVERQPRETGPGEGLPPVVSTTGMPVPAVAPVEPPPPVRAAVLLAPVALGRPGEQVAARSVPAAPLEVLVERVRQGEARFHAVRAEVRDGAVVLHSGAARGEDVTALADVLRRLPGVKEVAVDD